MAADLRLVAHATQRHAGEAAPQRLRDALPERGLAHAGRTHETQNAAARRGVEGADRQILEDPLLDGLQVVVVAVEDVARGLQVEPVLRRAAPGQRRDHLEVRAGHMVLGRLRRHLAQALELPVDDLLRLVVQAGGLEPAGELGQLVLSLFLAQLLADHPQLLAQHVLPLILIEARAHLLLELQVLEVGSQIQEKVRTRLDQNQREYVLREQLRVIRQELGEEEGEDELTELAGRLEAAGLHDEAKKVVDRELKRLRQMSPQSAEYHVARTYLEVIASLPWGRTSEDRLDLKAARDILDRDHYDLKPVKERILEYLAGRTPNPAARRGILGFVGPPGA